MRRTRLLTPLLALALTTTLAACGNDATAPQPVTLATVEGTTFAPSLGIDLSAAGWTKTASGLYYRTLSAPTAASTTVGSGMSVTVRYTGWLTNGTQFQSSSFSFVLGRGEVVRGFDEGIAGMRVGERRRLLIPPALGYGAQANGPIPSNSVLVFDVEVVSAG